AQPAAGRLGERFLAAPDPHQLEVVGPLAHSVALRFGQRAQDRARTAGGAADVDADLARSRQRDERDPARVREVEARAALDVRLAVRAVDERDLARRYAGALAEQHAQ